MEEEADPLEAFMSSISATIAEQEARKATAAPPPQRLALDEDEDEVEAYVVEKARRVAAAADAAAAEAELDCRSGQDNDINLLLPAVESHSAEVFRRDLYTEHSEVRAMDEKAVAALRESLELEVSGGGKRGVPRPVRSFEEAGFDVSLLKAITQRGYQSPTPVQSQILPVVMSGRDAVVLAKTGSGKTLGFVWPMLVHIMDQRELEQGEGPISIVLSPTRELAHQIYVEAKRFAKVYGCKACAVYGGASKWEQQKALKQLCEVVVATPGRLIDLIKCKACPTSRVTMLVLDEADVLMNMGFEPQVRTLSSQIRPDRQTLLFSATFPRRVQGLVHDLLRSPVRVSVGAVGQANEAVEQIAVVLSNDSQKWGWLAERVNGFNMEGKVLVFVSTKAGCDELCQNINLHHPDTPCRALHGDMQQASRSAAVNDFKQGRINMLIATDVASRGLDIKDVRTVVCFDSAKNADTHVHRVGRAGRMSANGVSRGTAFSLVTRKETKFAGLLAKNLELSKQPVPPALFTLACKDPGYRKHGGNAGNFHLGRGRGAQRTGSGRSDVKGKNARFVGIGFGKVGSAKDHRSSANTYLGKQTSLEERGFAGGGVSAVPVVRRGEPVSQSRDEIRAEMRAAMHQHVSAGYRARFVHRGLVGGSNSDCASLERKSGDASSSTGIQPELEKATAGLSREERNALVFTQIQAVKQTVQSQLRQEPSVQRAQRALAAARAAAAKVGAAVAQSVPQNMNCAPSASGSQAGHAQQLDTAALRVAAAQAAINARLKVGVPGNESLPRASQPMFNSYSNASTAVVRADVDEDPRMLKRARTNDSSAWHTFQQQQM